MYKLTFLLLLISSVGAFEESFKLMKVYPQNQKHLDELNKLAESSYVDVWHASAERYDLFVSESFLSTLDSFLSLTQCPSILSDIDIAKEVHEEAERLKARSPQFDYNNFNDLKTIEKEIERLAAKCIPGFVCTIETVGFSAEKRPIKKLVISKAGAKRKVQWLDATTHAREWLTTATLMKIIKHFYDNHNETTVKHFLNTYDWHFIPVVNPDGYVYSWASPAIKNRMWRKNRVRSQSNPNCYGIDVNRNFDQFWGTEGASADPCSESYRGPSPASELETKALQEQFKKLDLLQVVSIHAYGHYWLTPYGHLDQNTKKCYVAPDAKETKRVADAAANAIEKVFNQTKWKRGDICTTIYPASGGSIDYAKAKGTAIYAGAPEVRGQSFIVPPNQIEPSYKEIWEGLVASIKAIEKA